MAFDKIKSKIYTQRKEFQPSIFEGKKVVFTNGCFDIVHRGHIEYLAKASEMGEKMVLGLNTDNSVKRLKGENRPVNDEYSRALLLASFEFIDAVILFEEDTPYDLIKHVKPDYLVKGSDYNPEEIVGYDIVKAKGGEVKTLDFVEGFSSTSIIEKIKNSY